MRRERRTTIGGQFAPRLIEMLESPAYCALSLSARRVLDRLEIEMAHHGGTDNGRLPVTYDDFQQYGIDRQAIAPAIREAAALGFVKITERGRTGSKAHRTPSLYRLTYRHSKESSGDGSHEWRKIETSELAQTIASAARRAKTGKSKPPREGKAAKENRRGGKTPAIRVENPPRKAASHGGENHPTGCSGETHPTIDISSGEARNAAA
jgi:hypothetical protein